MASGIKRLTLQNFENIQLSGESRSENCTVSISLTFFLVGGGYEKILNFRGLQKKLEFRKLAPTPL